MNSLTALRLLPWLSAEGKPCFLVPGEEGGIVSRLADEKEARQLADGLDVLRSARRVLDDPLTPNVEVRYAALRLTECLADVLRVAESRGRRLLSTAEDGAGDLDAESDSVSVPEAGP
ncbi:hypothetical protein OHB56_17985 [Streptomyces sp. NBC_01635]|uniref:Uncharacterized protein n=1 Tax=Streptomyces hirsutus TaxID=35620 RepID=A0ABZ1GNW9_9ACTN|nr:hypothetical protein [Streptomyces hirsutus]WSD07113.1 hypothetical protein OIE73_15975 [Streptomyces hirsutus]WTD75624.1 hypothetical protein OHB56_17985 [Streptomyces sp. NBC_01635]